ncbi:MAG TPA: glycosyltransferase family 4 protein [Acidobacteriota bacterium]|nr:glycosyltransferase family 4 protein [Acidobacteriota bacterium]
MSAHKRMTHEWTHLSSAPGNASSPGGILLVSPGIPGSFVRQDVAFLKCRFDVAFLVWQNWGSLAALRRAIRRSDAVVVWFAGRHALPAIWLARRHRRPVAIIVGGWEAAWVPEVRYGIPPRSIRRRVLQRVLRAADILLPVSDATKEGTLNLVPDMADRTRRIYHAVDTTRFHFDPETPRRTVLTVGNFSRETITIKGLRLFWQAAALLPDLPFVAVGPTRDRMGEEFVARRPANLTWTGPLEGQELLARFREAKVYFQGSLHESFSVSTAEAMACGCIPAVTRRGALPEVVGDTGVYLETLTADAAAAAIRDAWGYAEPRRADARQRVMDLFSPQRRRQELCESIDTMIEEYRAR